MVDIVAQLEELVEQGTGTKTVPAKTTATIKKDEPVNVIVKAKNTGNTNATLHVGASIRRPDGQIIQLPPKTDTNVSPGETFSVTFNARTGCLAPQSGGPVPNVNTFKQPGNYDVITRVWGGKQQNPNNCFDVGLTNPLTPRIIITGAAKIPGAPEQQPLLPTIPDIPDEIAGIDVPEEVEEFWNNLSNNEKWVVAGGSTVLIGAAAADEETRKKAARPIKIIEKELKGKK